MYGYNNGNRMNGNGPFGNMHQSQNQNQMMHMSPQHSGMNMGMGMSVSSMPNVSPGTMARQMGFSDGDAIADEEFNYKIDGIDGIDGLDGVVEEDEEYIDADNLVTHQKID